MPSFVSDTIGVGISKVLTIGFRLLTTVVIARCLGPEVNGQIAALMVYPALFMTFGSLGIRQSTAYLVGGKHYDLEQIKSSVVHIWLFTSAFSIVASFFLIRIASNSGGDPWYALLAVLPIPFSLFCTYNTGIFLGQNKIKEFSRINWLPSLFVAIAALLLVFLLRIGISGAMLATLIGPVVMSVILLFRNRFLHSFSLSYNSEIIKRLLGLGSIYALALLTISLNYKIDVIILDRLSTAAQLGIYSKGAHMIEYLWHIPMLFSTLVFARSTNAQDKDLFSRKVTVLLRISLLLVGASSLVLAVIAPQLIVLLFGSAFAPSAVVLRILLPGVVLLTFFKVMNMDLAGRGKPWIAMIAMIPALVVNVIMNIWLIPSHGANGAAIASTVSYSLAGITFLTAYCRETGQSPLEVVTYRKSDFEELIKRVPLLKKYIRSPGS